ncbi:MAG: serine/threonine-protein kinase [Kofleriaceae bacterium]
MATIESTQVVGSAGATADTPLAPGQVVEGKYQLVALLGEGGMGAVWDAENVAIGRRVAIKVLRAQVAGEAEIVARFIQEARSAAAVGNEHIIDVLDLGKLPDGAPYIVMERLEGRDLEALIEAEGPLPVARVARIAIQICAALSAAHAKGIVHRDLKPPNVFLTRRGGERDFVKVLDFGISKVRGTGSLTPTAKTQTGITMGTPHYMSPEQAQGKPSIDHRADLYSLGVILYAMFTGKVPFEGDNIALVLARILRDEAEPPSVHRSGLPRYVDDLVLRLLRKDPDARFSSCEELSAALAPLAEQDDALVPRHAWTPVPGALETLSAEPAAGPIDTRPVAAVDGGVETAAAIAAVQRGSRTAWFAAAGLAVVGAVVAVIAMRGGDDAPARAAAVAPPDAAPTVVVAPPPPDAATVAPTDGGGVAPAAEVRVQLTVVPAEATIYVGGVRFPSPVDARQARSLEPTRIVIEHPGYKPKEDLVIFDRDVERRYVLERLGGSASTPPRRGSGASSGSGAAKPAEGSGKPADDGVYRGNQGTIRGTWD